MRTKGAVSFGVIKLSELTQRFGPNADIIISRKFAQVNNLPIVAMIATTNNISAATPVEASEPEILATEVA